LDNKDRSTKTDGFQTSEEKRIVPGYVKYGLIAVAVVAVIVVGLLLFFNMAGGVVATVDGEKITSSEFKYFLLVQKQSMLSEAYRVDQNINEDTFWATKIGGEDANEVAKKKALDAATELKVQYAKAKAAKTSLTSEETANIDASIKTDIIDALGEGNKIKANKALEEQYGFSIDVFKQVMVQNYTVQKFVGQELQNIPDAEVSDVEAAYKKNPEWFKDETQFRVNAEEAVWARHILFRLEESSTDEEKAAAKKKAEDLIVRLKAGEDFAALAKENSEDPGSADRGGDYLFGRGQMHKEFEDVAFGLNPGQITETPVFTASGYHILKLEEKVAKDEPVSLKCAKEYYEYNKDFLKVQLYMDRVSEWVNSAKVVVNLSAYNSFK